MEQPQQAEQAYTEQVDNEIAEIVEQIRIHQSIVEDNMDDIQALKERLAELLEARGANWSDDDGYARLVSAGTRIYYDTSALDDLIIKDPLHYGWLKDFRRESTVSSRVQVK